MHVIVSSVIKPCSILLHPARDMNHPFVQQIHAVYITSLLKEKKKLQSKSKGKDKVFVSYTIDNELMSQTCKGFLYVDKKKNQQ